MNFLIMSKYQIFNYLVTKTNSITQYFGPKYGPPNVFWVLNKNLTVPIDNKKSHLYNNSDCSSSNSSTLELWSFLTLSSCSTHKLYFCNWSFVFGQLNLFKSTLICCICNHKSAISCWSKETVSGWLCTISACGNFHTTCTVVNQVTPNKVQNETCPNWKIPLPCCRLCFPDSKYTSFSETHLILSELQPLKISEMWKKWRNLLSKIGVFLFQVVDLGSLIPNM